MGRWALDNVRLTGWGAYSTGAAADGKRQTGGRGCDVCVDGAAGAVRRRGGKARYSRAVFNGSGEV